MARLGRLVRRRAPDVDALVATGDYVGLVEAARYQHIVEISANELADLGVPVREAALLALGDLEDIGSFALADALADPFEEVRAAAVDALRRRGEFETLCIALAGWTDGADGRARGAAINALLELRAEGSSFFLVRALVSGRGDYPIASGDAALVRTMLETEAREGASAEVVSHLVETLSAATEAERKRAKALLVNLAPMSVEPLLEELREGSARASAASILGEIKDRRAVEPLSAALEEPDPRLREAACLSLGELRDPVAVEPLMHLTRDPEHAVRVAAGAALDQFGTIAVLVGVAALVRPRLEQGETEPSEPRLLTNGSSSEDEAPQPDLAILASELFNRAGR
jgi:HEAT repeat protein